MYHYETYSAVKTHIKKRYMADEWSGVTIYAERAETAGARKCNVSVVRSAAKNRIGMHGSTRQQVCFGCTGDPCLDNLANALVAFEPNLSKLLRPPHSRCLNQNTVRSA